MHRRVKNLLSGLRVQEAVQYDAPKAAAKSKEKSKKNAEPSAGSETAEHTPSGEGHA